MKALKEKRISLRSLWRGGLVILSLFALVFASCSDSSSGGGDSGGKRVNKMVTTVPATQYLGRPVDLTGAVAKVTYADGTTDTIKYEGNEGKFTAYPPVVTGLYSGTGLFFGMTSVRVHYDADGEKCSSDVALPAGQVVGIRADDADIFWGDLVTEYGVFPADKFYSGGLSVTGVNSRAQVAAFVDDTCGIDKFDFGGLVLQAVYADGAVLPLSFDDVYWEIRPDYDLPRNADADQSYKGYVYITVGRPHPDVDWAASLPHGIDVWKGMTVLSPLDTVYTVYDEATGIKFVSDPDTDYYFWQPNTPASWGAKLPAIQVRYRGTAETKTFTYDEIAAQRLIWYNANPGVNDRDYWVTPLKYPFIKAALKYNGAPAVEVYYRGGKINQPINVYTKLLSLEATADGVTWNSEETDDERDNDVEIPGEGGEKGLTDLFTVRATYQAYNDTQKQGVITLSPQLALSNPAYNPSLPFNVTTNNPYLDPTTSGVATYDGAYYYTTYWSVAPSITKDGKSKAVRIVHRVESAKVEALLGRLPNDIFNGSLSGQQKQKNIPVKWIYK